MVIDEGKDAWQTKLGALCSLLFLITMLTFTSYKISILVDRKSIDIIQAVKENHFDDTDVFGVE